MAEWTKGTTEIGLAEARYDAGRLAKLTAYYDGLIAAGKVQAAGFLLARKGRVFANQTAGRRTTAADSDPLRPDHIKNIASITKIVTSTAIMQLVEDGVLWLEMPVKAILKEFDTPMHGGIQIKHLLTHTSGLPADGGYFTEPYPVEGWEETRKDGWLTKVVLAGPLQSLPGETWSYSSLCFGVLAEIVTRVSGMHFNDYVADRIFRAIGMDRTFMEVPKPLHGEVILSAEWDPIALEHSGDRVGMPGGGGGCYSTMRDLARLAQCFLDAGSVNGKRLLGKKTAAEMVRNQLEGVGAFHWGKHLTTMRQGLGWEYFVDGSTVGPDTFQHEGWGWCSLFVDPVEDFVFVAFTPTPTDWNPEVMVNPRTIAFSGLL
jgi:CubicO group peptidase (beta-lactamase class C family)